MPESLLDVIVFVSRQNIHRNSSCSDDDANTSQQCVSHNSRTQKTAKAKQKNHLIIICNVTLEASAICYGVMTVKVRSHRLAAGDCSMRFTSILRWLHRFIDFRASNSFHRLIRDPIQTMWHGARYARCPEWQEIWRVTMRHQRLLLSIGKRAKWAVWRNRMAMIRDRFNHSTSSHTIYDNLIWFACNADGIYIVSIERTGSIFNRFYCQHISTERARAALRCNWLRRFELYYPRNKWHFPSKSIHVSAITCVYSIYRCKQKTFDFYFDLSAHPCSPTVRTALCKYGIRTRAASGSPSYKLLILLLPVYEISCVCECAIVRKMIERMWPTESGAKRCGAKQQQRQALNEPCLMYMNG